MGGTNDMFNVRAIGSDAERTANLNEERTMAAPETIRADDEPGEPIPAMQQLLDNPFLLLFIGVAVPTVLYVVWGVMEIVGIPVAR